MFLSHCIQFLEGMQLNYNSQAADKGVYVIGSCGFDSIPADMGVLYTRDQFKGKHIMKCKQSLYTHSNSKNEQVVCSCSFCYDSVIYCHIILFIHRYADCSGEFPDCQRRT